jgi:hypothetical protein
VSTPAVIHKSSTDIDLYYPEHDFAVLVVPKCGGTSIRRALGQNEVSRDVARQATTRLAVIRHPVARMISAWHFGWRRQMPFDRWWRYVRDNTSFDIHVTPAHELLRDDYTDVQCLEEIHWWWREYHKKFPFLFPAERVHENKTPIYRWHDLVDGRFHYYVDEIMDVYRQDLNLWKRTYGAR